MSSSSAAAGRRKLSARPSSSNAINIPVVVTSNCNDSDDDDDDEVFVDRGKENAGNDGGVRGRCRRRTTRSSGSTGGKGGATLFPSLSNHSTSRSPIRSLCVNSSPGRRAILRNGGWLLNCGDNAATTSTSTLTPCKSDSALATPDRAKRPRRTLVAAGGGKVKILGRGSFGSVVLGEWQGQRVAVKLISPQGGNAARTRSVAGGGNGMSRCRTESVASEANAVGLSHPNIVRVHGIFRHDDDGEDGHAGTTSAAMVVMEYVGQSNLQRLLDTMPEKIDAKFMQRCFTDISCGLSFVHSRSLAHLDVKPANVFVTAHGRSKLGDFGCSRRVATSSPPTSTSTSSPSPTPPGTSGYQCPHLLRRGAAAATDRCDVYSFGVLLWQVARAGGRTPFAGMHAHAVIYQVVSMHKRPSCPQQESASSLKMLDPHTYKFYRRLYRECWAQEDNARPAMSSVHQRLVDHSQRRNSTDPPPQRKSSSIRL